VLAGQKGLGLLSFTLLVSPEELGRRVQTYREAIKTANPPGAFINNKAGAFSLVHCADTDKQAQEEADRAFMSYVGTTLQVTTPVLEARKAGKTLDEITANPNREIKEYEGIDPRKVNMQFLLDNGMCVAGNPDTCIKQIERIQKAANLDLFLCMMQFWPIPHEQTMHAIDLFGKHVIPYFKKKA
jgi:alkanesulfonate monooxygenase SsuD/methylene tetrahydromethanopterin reductase-like flavin-dependent oxidoreductase (luciferase family)